MCVSFYAATDYEYGTPSDLRGLSIYYVDTGTDIATRNEIAAKLREQVPALRLANAREDAQISVDVTGNDGDDDGAVFIIYVAGKEGRARLIQKFAYTHSKLSRLRPTSRFARDFAKLWHDAQSSGQ